jgi:hypothetical protein
MGMTPGAGSGVTMAPTGASALKPLPSDCWLQEVVAPALAIGPPQATTPGLQTLAGHLRLAGRQVADRRVDRVEQLPHGVACLPVVQPLHSGLEGVDLIEQAGKLAFLGVGDRAVL